MLHVLKTLSTVAIFGTLSACTNAENPGSDRTETANSYAFKCGDTAVAADYSDSGEVLTLTVDGQVYVLPSVVSASGAKYERVDEQSSVMFWSKGDWAMMEINGKKYPDCSAN